jgi:hypothetical protein
MRRAILALPLFIVLGGCAGSVLGDAIAGPEAVAEREDSYCRSIGLQFGTPEYASCRMQTTQGRQARHQMAIQGAAANMQRSIDASRPVQMAPRTCNSSVIGNQVQTNCY